MRSSSWRPSHHKKLLEHQNILLEHVYNGVVHPVTGKVIDKYKTLIQDDLLRDTWEEAMCVELG